ncbi:MAG: TspO/MBR family protein [Panacagrimonas sp.]
MTLAGSDTRPSIWKPIAAALSAATLVSVFGAAATDLSPWYYALDKPTWQPPDWLFGPAWTTIFALSAIAGVLAWKNAPDRARRSRMVQLFAVNLALNMVWSLLFFRMRRPDFALVEVAALWLSIAVLIFATWSYSRPSSLLLLPYLAWVSFASFLNFAIVRLNSPFTGA